MGTQILFDAHGKGDIARGTTDAGSMKADGDFAPGTDGDELDIAAVGLNGGAHEFNHPGDSVFDLAGDGCGGAGWLVSSRHEQ